jgi:hypothetical protein
MAVSSSSPLRLLLLSGDDINDESDSSMLPSTNVMIDNDAVHAMTTAIKQRQAIMMDIVICVLLFRVLWKQTKRQDTQQQFRQE